MKETQAVVEDGVERVLSGRARGLLSGSARLAGLARFCHELDRFLLWGVIGGSNSTTGEAN